MMQDCESPAYLGAEIEPYPLEAMVGHFAPERIVEVGPGSGHGTLQVMKQFPAASVTCLEPGDAARSTVTWRVLDAGGLGSRVSVLPLTVEDADFLPPADLLVARHVTCQVPVDARSEFWASIARLLRPGGRALVDDHFGPTASTEVPRKLAAEGGLGDYRVSRWFSAHTIDASRRRVMNEYVFTDSAGVVVHRELREEVHVVVDQTEQLAILALAGLEVVVHEAGWLVLSRSKRSGGVL